MVSASGISPNSSDLHSSTPKSTESEQSQALDMTGSAPEIDFSVPELPSFEYPLATLFDELPPYMPDQRGTTDPTMTSTFGIDFGDFGSMTMLGTDAVDQLSLNSLLEKADPAPVIPTPSSDVDLLSAYVALGWCPLPVAIEPSLLVSTCPPPKRKAFDTSTEAIPVKRPRGRPPKFRIEPKRPYRRQSKSGSSVPSLVAAVLTNTPASCSFTLADEDDSDAESDVPARRTGKASTARPKSVVPEKYLKDGSAQTIVGMSVDQIASFPTFEELLKLVSPGLRTGAAEFGERIKENRDKAKDAAKKSRDERRLKIDTLEKSVSDLESKIVGMQGVFEALVRKGILSEADVISWM